MRADYYLILAGDHLYRMDYTDLIDAHIDRHADITLAAQPVTIEDASAMGIVRFDRTGQIVAFEEKPTRERLHTIERSIPSGATVVAPPPETPFMASMGIYVFSRDVLLDVLASDGATDFGREIIPAALGRYRVNSYLFRGYWADVGTIASFYEANIILTRPGAPFRFYDPRRPIYTHARFSPRRALQRLHGARRHHHRGLLSRAFNDRGVDRRHPHQRAGRRTHSPIGAAWRRLL